MWDAARTQSFFHLRKKRYVACTMPRTLAAWIGNTDLKAPEGVDGVVGGPIAQAIDWGEFDSVILFSNYERERHDPYLTWLAGRGGPPIKLHTCRLPTPTAFAEIYETVVKVLRPIVDAGDTELTLHLSPGTPAMAAVWIILAKTRFPASLIESSVQGGVRPVHIPFSISAEFIPTPDPADARIQRLTAGEVPLSDAFVAILHQSDAMRRVLGYAQRAAGRSVPVLIEGESGTGKELLARAIHNASPRAGGPFVEVNCGAIPAGIVESELFGHKKGAFSGAADDRLGHFESANGGTIFLDEIGELPLPVQVALLRVLAVAKVTRVGDTKARGIDVRVIAATNRSLLGEVAARRFREDLFYRLAVARVELPPLRERRGDLGMLIDSLLLEVNRAATPDSGIPHKTLSPTARNLLLAHSWPGNVRELLNTLHRAAIWSPGDTIDEEDVRVSLFQATEGPRDALLGRDLGPALDVLELQAQLARHYLRRALDAAGGIKSKAAELIGLGSYQTLTNWMKKYGVSE